MRITTFLAAIAITAIAAPLAAPLAAQSKADPTTQVKGNGQLPAGWLLRFDPPRVRPGRPTPPTPSPSAVKFVTMGDGYHVTSGPAALYYNTKDMGAGAYEVTATFAQQKSMNHEAYGLFIGGAHLQDSTQNYLYFIIRPMDGKAMISHRSSDAPPKALIPYFASDAIHKDDPADGHATNQLAIRVDADSVRFIANGTQIAALAKSQLDGAHTAGQVGLRINHNLDLHISNYELKKQ
jgi:hypothetical protein